MEGSSRHFFPGQKKVEAMVAAAVLALAPADAGSKTPATGAEPEVVNKLNKFSDIKNKISPVVREWIEIHNQDKKKSEDIFKVMQIYNYIPRTESDVSILFDDKSFLLREPVISHYQYLVKNLGYKFDPTFISTVRGLSNFSNLEGRMVILDLQVHGQPSNFVEKNKAKLEKNTDTAISDVLDKAKKDLEHDAIKKSINKFVETFHVPLSAAGLEYLVYNLFYDYKDHPENIPAFDAAIGKKTAAESGSLWHGNEMLFILYAIHNPEGWDRFIQITQSLHQKRPREVISIDQLNEVSNEKLVKLVPYWNWLEEKISPKPFNLSSADSIATSYDDLKIKIPDEQAIVSDATAERIAIVRQLLGYSEDYVAKHINRLQSLVWTDAEIATYRQLAQFYSLAPTDQEFPVNFVDQLDTVRAAQYWPHLVDKDQAPIYQSIIGGRKYKTKDYLADLIKIEKTLAFLEEAAPNTREIFALLVRTGVSLSYVNHVSLSLSMSRHSASAQDSLNQAKVKIAGIARNFKENPRLIQQWEQFSTRFIWDKPLTVDDVSAFCNFSPAAIDRLSAPNLEVDISLLRDKYDFFVTFGNMLDYSNLDPVVANSALTELRSADCAKMYDTNKSIFPKDTKDSVGFGKFQWWRLETIADFYKQLKDDPEFLTDVKRWMALSKTDHVDFVSIAEIKKPANRAALKNPKLPELMPVFERLGFGGNVKSLDFAASAIDFLPMIQKPDFIKFYNGLYQQKWFATKSEYDLPSVAALYGNPETRAILSSDMAYAFFQQLQEYGYAVSAETFAEFVDLYKTPGLLAKFKEIETLFGIDAKEQIGKIMRGAGDPMGDFSFMLLGLKSRGFNFVIEVKDLAQSGDLAILLSPQSKALVTYLEKTFHYAFSVLDISSIVTVVKNPSLLESLRDPAAKQVFDRVNERARAQNLEMHFSLDMTDFVVTVKDKQKEFFWFVGLLEKQFDYVWNSPGELNVGALVTLQDLAFRGAIVSELKRPEMKQLVADLKVKQNYVFSPIDAHALIFLLNNPAALERLFDPTMDLFAEKYFNAYLGKSLKDRLEFSFLYNDAPKRQKIESQDFKHAREKLLSDFGVVSGMHNIDSCLIFMEHPEISVFLKAINYAKLYDGVEKGHFLNSMPSLVRLAKLHAESYITKVKYNFNPNDGLAWEKLIELYPNVDDLVRQVGTLEQRLGKNAGTMIMNEIYIGLTLGDKFSIDRGLLEADISTVFASDIHRVDNNFNSYISYNNPQKLSLLQLNKVRLLREFFGQEEVKQEIGRYIVRDIHEYPFTELGSVVVLHPDGSLEHQEFPPQFNLVNGSYMAPPESVSLEPVMIATGHQHALTYNEGNYAGPSGGRFAYGADITSAQVNQTDNFVVTSISKTRFCVHFFTPEGHVIFLGNFDRKRLPATTQ